MKRDVEEHLKEPQKPPTVAKSVLCRLKQSS